MTNERHEPLFAGLSFARVLSLGGNCEAARGLRVAGRHSANGIFDWIVTPLDAIAAILVDDGARLGTEFIAVHGGTSVRCGAYGVLYHHEFPRDAENRVVFGADAVAACRAKLIHKMATFVGLCDGPGPVLFIRFGIGTDLPWDRFRQGGATPRAADLDALAAAVARRFPALAFRILAIPLGAERDVGRPRDPRVAVEDLPPSPLEGGWAVNEAAWRGLMSRVVVAEGGNARNEPIGETLHWFEDDVARLHAEPGGPRADAERVEFSEDPSSRGRLDAAFDAVWLENGTGPRDALDGAMARLAALVECGAEPPARAWTTGLDLRRRGLSHEATHAFALAYHRGFRDLRFLRDYLGLLTGEARYGEVLDLVDDLKRQGVAALHPLAARQLAMLSGHAKLALARPRDAEIALAEARFGSPAALDAPGLLDRIAAAIRERRPFSFLRVGDGEARYLIAATHDGEGPLTAGEAHAMGDIVWENWFGEPLAEADPAHRTTLLVAYEDAVRTADVLGVCTPGRLRADTGHYGYLAWQERWLRDLLDGRTDVLWADALVCRALNSATPFLAALLEGLDVLMVISPHPRLAEALRNILRVGRVIGHVVPAEGRLPTAAETRKPGRHFPAIYDDLLASLTLPRPGCVVLIAAGLLGKIYCARVKALGGIALDIGALADAWMGYDTRDGQHAGIAALPPTPAPEPERRTTYGCVSMGKTGSMALAAALRDAGVPDAVHLHFLGPRALATKRAAPEPMVDLALDVAGRIGAPDCDFRFVTSVRDPIARVVSQAFYRAENHREARGVDIVRDRDALIAWWEAHHMARRHLWAEWFDDTFKATFGFDFRQHPFDHARKSLRFTSNTLRLLVLRQEDEQSRREAELGWLLGRDGVVLRRINDAANQNYEAAYRSFLDAFVAPDAWLDTYYETEVIKHFYTAQERAAFKDRWRGGARPRRAESPPSQAEGDGGTAMTPARPQDAGGPPTPAGEVARLGAELETLRARLRDGRAVDFNDYAYRPRERDWAANPGADALKTRFAGAESAYAGLLERFCGFDDRFRAIPVLPEAGAPHWENWWLPGMDAVALYGLVATHAPRTYLEIGSGHSTRFVRRAIRDHSLPTRLVSVDPSPTADVDALCDEVVRTRCEDAPASIFAALGAGDMLFFDGSHRSFQNSDATVFFTEILPSLAPGVVYGIHDVFLPYDYPESWTNRFYNEQYLLMAYLLGGANGDEVVFPAHHVWREPAFAPLRNRLFLGTKHLDWLTSSFWMRRGGLAVSAGPTPP